MDAADPLAGRPEEGPEKPKGGESQDDGYETSNSGEARRAEPEPPPADPPAPPPPLPPPPQNIPPPQEYDMQQQQLMRPLQNYPSPYRQFEQPEEQYQHFPFPKYSNDPYSFKREPDAPYDMSHHPHHQHQQELYNGVKRECDDPYSFAEEEMMMMSAQHSGHHPPPHEHAHMMHQQMMLNQPKKRGRKKKIKDENGMEIKAEGMEGVVRPVKERKKHDRFNGMSEEEVARRTLPDHLAENLDIIIIGINPGLFAAYKGHHYAGPGNHFWKCLYLSGLTREQMSADEDYKLLNFGIGFTNMVPRPTKGSADLTRREIKEGSAALLDKLQTFRPKVAVFNGKLIYEVFSGKKDFCFGKQPDTIAGTNTYMWVMPSSSARCAQLPRAADKVPFYAALKKFRDYLNGLIPHIEEAELVFPDTTTRRPHEEMEIRRSKPQQLSKQLTMEPEPGDTIILEDGTEVPLKKKRGRPKKVKLENGEVVPPTPRAPRAPRPPPALGPNGEEPPKKKRGRPKKIRPEEQQFLLQQQQQQAQQQAQQQQQQQQQQQSNPVLQGPGPGPGPGAGQLPMSGLPHEQQYGGMGFQCDQQMYLQQGQYYTNANNSSMDSPNMDMSGLPLQRGGGAGGGYPSPSPTPAAPPAHPAAPPPQQYAGSPRTAYHSPRSQGYSPGPAPQTARHQPTPQPQFPSSPAGNVSGPPVPNYGSNSRLGNLSGRSPLYAGSPAPYGGAHPPAPSPHTPHPYSPQYSRSPAPPPPQPVYSRSPAPAAAGSTPAGAFGASSPGGPYTPSPQHTPYSQHSSPAPSTQPPPAYTSEQHYNQTGSNTSGSGSAGSGSYGAELSSDIGAAISSPPAPSPPLAVDFEPPRDSPIGSTDMHPGSNSNSSLSDYNKAGSQAGSEMSPAGSVGVGGGQFGTQPAMQQYEGGVPYHMHSPGMQDQQGNSGVGSPRLDQMHQHQHPAMYPNNFNRSTPDGGAETQGFRPPDAPHTPHHPGSPASYGEPTKSKSQDVASKSLSGLESLVDQIPSIADGPSAPPSAGSVGVVGVGSAEDAPAPVPSLPEYAPALYGPYSAYGGSAYANNGYGASPFVGYGGGWGGVMRPTPGYLPAPDWPPAYSYAGVGVGAVPPSYAPYNSPYYNGYTPPHAHTQQTHYLSAPPLLELHKNGEQGVGGVGGVPSVPSVGFGGFC